MTSGTGHRRNRWAPRSLARARSLADGWRIWLDRHEKPITAAAIVAGFLTVVTTLWLALLALDPDLRDHQPSWLRWFGEPGTLWAALVLAGLFLLTLFLRWLPHQRWPSASTTLALASMTVGAAVLGFTSYLRCHSGPAGNGALRAVYETLLLFVGGLDDGIGARCVDRYPVALDVARIVGVLVLLLAAVAAGIKLFRSQIDRASVRFGGPLTIVVGVDDDVVALVRDIAQSKIPGTQLLVITSNADRDCVRATREAKARIIELNLDEAANLARLRVWHRARRVYLLSADPQSNFTRFNEIDEAVGNRGRGLGRAHIRVPLTVRVDDPWHAESWRRQLMSGKRRRWAPEAVGRYEATATRLAYQLMSRPVTPKRVYVEASAPLTYSLLLEFSQIARERRLTEQVYDGIVADRGGADGLRRPDLPAIPEVTVLGPAAAGLQRDYEAQQERTGAGDSDLVVNWSPDSAGIERLDGILLADSLAPEADPRHDDPVREDQTAVILERDTPEGLTDGTRLAARFPRLPLYVGGDTVGSLSSGPVVGELINFPIALDADKGVPQDVWERAAILKHRLYCIDQDPAKPSAAAWDDLDEFYKGSNRREILNVLWTVEEYADCTWASLEDPPLGVPDLGEVAESETVQGCKDKAALLGIEGDDFDDVIHYEHQDWVDYHYREGWRHGDAGGSGVERKKREFATRTSADLIDWDEYTQNPDNLAYPARSLLRALQVLAVLGFRPMPQWHDYPRQPTLVTATQLTEPFTWRDDHRDEKVGRPGDWLILEGDTTRTVVDEFFHQHYEPVDGQPDTYRRIGSGQGRRAVPGEHVHSLEGDGRTPDVAEQGDHVFRSARGDKWRVGESAFGDLYVDVRQRSPWHDAASPAPRNG
ncbi:MAG: hypothetical protein QM774_09820 [Gordonia sp. (in: high G+C Gram-positive bacteria)]|uniref:hypothetical protein n=1 Tax=Gordonia sp. (in: high G+C Gram-positive bacteria) TaxID=84139 RepID=UPI0039E41855